VEVITLSLSNLINGKEEGLLPVAIIIFFDSITISSSEDLIFTLFLSTKEPKPL